MNYMKDKISKSESYYALHYMNIYPIFLFKLL